MQRVSFAIGNERDAFDIVRNTAAYQPMLEYIQDLKQQHDKEMSIFERYSQINIENDATSNEQMDVEDDGILDRELILGSKGEYYTIFHHKNGDIKPE